MSFGTRAGSRGPGGQQTRDGDTVYKNTRLFGHSQWSVTGSREGSGRPSSAAQPHGTIISTRRQCISMTRVANGQSGSIV